jgi:hypothetical protein
MPLCSECSFNLGTLFVSLEKVFLTPDTTISVKSEGIKPEYALFNFYRDNISIFYFLFPDCYSFRSAYALFSALCVILVNQKQRGNGFPLCVCSLLCALLDLGKSET